MKMNHYYHSCVFSATAMILQTQLERGETTETVDFVFDEMTGLLEECIAFYKEAKPFFPPERRAIAGGLAGANDTLVEPLQAADVLAARNWRPHIGSTTRPPTYQTVKRFQTS